MLLFCSGTPVFCTSALIQIQTLLSHNLGFTLRFVPLSNLFLIVLSNYVFWQKKAIRHLFRKIKAENDLKFKVPANVRQWRPIDKNEIIKINCRTFSETVNFKLKLLHLFGNLIYMINFPARQNLFNQYFDVNYVRNFNALLGISIQVFNNLLIYMYTEYINILANSNSPFMYCLFYSCKVQQLACTVYSSLVAMILQYV